MSGCCCNETNPQTADVTVEANTYEGLAPSLESPANGVIVLTMPDVGRFHVKAWLVDNNTDYWGTTPSANLADTPPDNVWDDVTDADGTYTFTTKKTGSAQYRLLCSVGGVVVASDAFYPPAA